ncbi:metallochaperone AztD [Szabonella alba]|uniref:Metallochaperone AztD n=1 Tax=Szabonella alba TaxID=2804194 RepID=A0A8K0VAR2_9RHOB|nr:metallochaperone AztD [Szabonella alba]MBL4918473.1 metallochaperone AztD [Szabonella alba]
MRYFAGVGVAALIAAQFTAIPARADDPASEDVTLYRVFIGDHVAPRVTVIDLPKEGGTDAEGDTGGRWSFETTGQAKLYTVAWGAVVAAVQSDSDTVQFFRSGIAFHDHGDHADIEITDPAAISTMLTGPRPFHLVDHDGKVVINYDRGGYAEILDAHRLAEGAVAPDRFPQARAHHGFVAPLGRNWLSTVASEEAVEGDAAPPRLGLQAFTAEGQPAGDLTPCTAIHGEAFSGAYLAAGCRDGVLTATLQQDAVHFRMLDYPADLPQGVTTGTLLGSTGMQLFLGNYGADGLVVVDPADAPHFRHFALPFRRVDFVLDPARPAHGYVLTEDGTLHRIDLLAARITQSAPVTQPYSMEGHWNDPRPRLAMAGDEILLTDPAAGLLRRISTETLAETGRIGIGGTPYNLTVAGGSGLNH